MYGISDLPGTVTLTVVQHMCTICVLFVLVLRLKLIFNMVRTKTGLRLQLKATIWRTIKVEPVEPSVEPEVGQGVENRFTEF